MTILDRFNPQVQKIHVSTIRLFDQRISNIPNIVKLTLGEPDFDTPEHVKQAGIQAIKENFSHYSGMSGLEELRRAASEFVKRKYNLHYCPEDEIMVTIGVTEAISASLLAILEEGDKVLLPTPIYPGYEPLITLSKATPVYMDTTEENFVLTPKRIREAMEEHGDKVKAIILNYPSNPTGVTYSREEVAAIAKELKKYPIFVISDEVYSELTYEEEHISIGEYLREQTIVLNGLSKSHAMTGWRIGFIFTTKEIAAQLLKVHQYLVTAAATMAQKAAIEALTKGVDDAIVLKKEYKKRRDFVFGTMNRLGFQVAKPNGAFYIFAKIPSSYIQNSMAFCIDLAEKKQVGIIPGIAFGQAGEGYVRISYAASMESLRFAMQRIEEYLKENKKENIS